MMTRNTFTSPESRIRTELTPNTLATNAFILDVTILDDIDQPGLHFWLWFQLSDILCVMMEDVVGSLQRVISGENTLRQVISYMYNML